MATATQQRIRCRGGVTAAGLAQLFRVFQRHQVVITGIFLMPCEGTTGLDVRFQPTQTDPEGFRATVLAHLDALQLTEITWEVSP